MKNQFLYTREVTLPGEEAKTQKLTDSFNLDFVIRSVEIEEGKRLVILNDFHEEMREVPEFHPKTRKPTGAYKKERNTYQSEIYLNAEDSVRFLELFK